MAIRAKGILSSSMIARIRGLGLCRRARWCMRGRSRLRRLLRRILMSEARCTSLTRLQNAGRVGKSLPCMHHRFRYVFNMHCFGPKSSSRSLWQSREAASIDSLYRSERPEPRQ